MPTYVYRREDGSTFEIQQRITADPLEHCPETGQKVTRVISANTGLIFKGSGFYLTDYGRNGSSATSNPTSGNADTSSSTSSSASSTSSSSND